MAPPPAPFACVIVAAGQGLRAGQPVPKQFAPWRGRSVLYHAVAAMRAAGAGTIAIAVPEGAVELTSSLLEDMVNLRILVGGATRQESVALALEALVPDAPELVLIHDAARPDCPPEVVERLLAALETAPGAIPVLPVVDSIVSADGTAQPRESLRRVQTPQAFHYAAILGAHRSWTVPTNAGDDAQVLQAAGGGVALVAGDERLKKLTVAEDFMDQPASPPPAPAIRVGTGFDVHRLVAGEELWLCGVRIDHSHGLSGHSDADVAIHALVDAILGAAAAGDIGQHFPPSDSQWRGAASARFLEHAVALAAQRGFAIGNVDVTIICEAPKIGPHRDAMRARLAAIMAVAVDAVSVKATTTERLGPAGRGEGIAAQAVATLVRG